MLGHLRDGVAAFYIRRFFRIGPLFYFMILAYVVRGHTIYSVSYSPVHVIENALYLFNFVPDRQSGIVWASWTIGVEMIFYLIFPIV